MYKIIHIIGSFLAALVLLGLVFALLPTPGVHLAASQTAIVVDTLEDELNNDGYCSLREAIQAAGDNVPVDTCPAGSPITDTITFSVAGMVLLDNQQLLVYPGGPLVIDGGQAITISGNNQVRIFLTFSGVDLTLRNLSLTDGYDGTQGGGIYNTGGLSIYNSTLTRNEVGDGDGGAIYNVGRLNIEHSTLSDNIAPFGNGGGIYNAISATAEVSSTNFLGNNAGWEGGGIFNQGEATVRGSSLSDGTARLGAGIDNYGVLYLSDSLISDNYAPDYGSDFDGMGAGIFTWEGTVTISNTIICANHAGRRGGGIYGIAYEPGAENTLTIKNSTISDNIADKDGGGIVTRNTLMTITNSTISTNTAGDYGGGIYNWFWGEIGVLVTHSTLSGNAAGVEGGNVHNYEWNIYTSEMRFQNTIIASSSSGGNCNNSVIDEGHNIEDTDTCGFSPANGSMPDTDPLLAPLQDNGGPTRTQALYPGSPAIDAAKPLYCPATDQRGVPRPVDGDGNGDPICDIGAYEFRQPTTTTITSDQPDSSYTSEPFTLTFSVTATQGIPTGTVTAVGGEGSCTGALSAGQGNCQMTIFAAGTYTLTATYYGNEVYDFSRGTEIHTVIPKKLYVYLPLIISDQ